MLMLRIYFCFYRRTDCGAIPNMISGNRYAKNHADAAAKALNGGTDFELGSQFFSPDKAGGNGALVEAISKKLTDVEHVNQALRRVLEKRFLLGQFDPLEG